MREPGYYWARQLGCEDWEVANWDGTCWWLTGWDVDEPESAITEIGPRVPIREDIESMAKTVMASREAIRRCMELEKHQKVLLDAFQNLHSDVISLVECLEECEPTRNFDTSTTRRLLGLAHDAIAKTKEQPVNHSPEPWRYAEAELAFTYGPQIIDAAGQAVICDTEGNHDAILPADARRIVAAVNFCQHLPTELIEKLTASKIGPATLAQWVRRNPTDRWNDDITGESNDCIECDHDLFVSDNHGENCLLKKFLDILEGWKL